MKRQQVTGTASASVPMAATVSRKTSSALSRSKQAAENGRLSREVPLNDFSRAKIDASVSELQEEKALVSDLIKPA